MSANKNINSVQVHIVKDQNGTWDPAASGTKMLDCGSKLEKNENLYILPAGDNCGTYAVGSVASPTAASSDIVATAKMRVPAGGYVWIPKTEFDTFITKCNECCI